jgi:hypothetical protein
MIDRDRDTGEVAFEDEEIFGISFEHIFHCIKSWFLVFRPEQ